MSDNLDPCLSTKVPIQSSLFATLPSILLINARGDRNCPLKIQIYLNCPGLRSSLEGISLVPTISDRRLLVYYKLRPPLIGLRRISYYEAVYNPGRKNVIFRPSMTIWGRSFLLQIILMGCWTHIKQEPSNYSLALPPSATYRFNCAFWAIWVDGLSCTGCF